MLVRLTNIPSEGAHYNGTDCDLSEIGDIGGISFLLNEDGFVLFSLSVSGIKLW